MSRTRRTLVRVALFIALPASAALSGCSGPPAAEASPGAPVGRTEQGLGHTVLPPVPDALRPPAGQVLKLKRSAVGVQIYTCAATATSYAYAFKAPEADLLSDDDFRGNHFLGPTWQSKDGSKVRGTVVASAASPDPSAIPWLLLSAVETGMFDGNFSDVTYIQRLSTTGGKAPASGCDAAHVGAEVRVDYTADYYFYRSR